MINYTTQEQSEKFESWLDEQLTGKYATGNLETELRMAVSQIRDMPELMPKDYAVQPLMRLIQQEVLKAIKSENEGWIRIAEESGNSIHRLTFSDRINQINSNRNIGVNEKDI